MNLKNLILVAYSAVYKNRYVVLTESGEISATLTGNFQYSVENQTELPTVGDWVVLQIFDEEGALIIKVLPRYSFIERRAVGKGFEQSIDCCKYRLWINCRSSWRKFQYKSY